jgi:DNA-binding CsgD family transcriptional regulator/tetratricopeptide (TPR) repeat protein
MGTTASGAGGGSPADGRLVGREAELARILSALDTMLGGADRLVLLSGEPGVGKTRLAQDVLARAGDRRMRVLVGRCFEQHTSVPFFPFSEALSVAFAGAPAAVQDDAQQRWPELVHLLPEFHLATAPPTLGGPDAQLHIFRAATAFFQSLAHATPLVLLLDDLHWADATSLGLLLYLARHLQTAPMLILGTFRDVAVSGQQPLEEVLLELVRERLVDEVHLRRFGVEGTAALIRERLAPVAVSDECVALVHNRAEGNPFFTEELLKALIEQGAVYRVADRWELNTSRQIELPHSVRSVVGQRVSRLGLGTQELLRLASVIGPEFELDVLLSASGQPESEVLDHLDAALQVRLIEERTGGPRERYAFAHVLIQQTLYQDLPGHRRRRLHRRVADALEPLHAGRPALAAELAGHFLLAGSSEHALRYSIQAGDQAATRYAHAEAAHQYEVALDLLLELGDATRVADVQSRLGSELCDLNRRAEALTAYEAALSTFERLGDITGQALVHAGIGRLHMGRYDLMAAVPHFDGALRLWPPVLENAQFASFLLDFAAAHYYGADVLAATPLVERSLRIAERLGDPSLLARSLRITSQLSFLKEPRPRIPMHLLNRVEEVARRAGDWRTLSHACMAHGVYAWLEGDLKQCLADRRRGAEAAERSGETERVSFAYQTVATACHLLGDWEAGRAAAQAGLALDPREQPATIRGAVFAWMQGRYTDAVDHLGAFLADARARGDMLGLSIALVMTADWVLQLDRPADAEAPAREASDLLRVGGRWQPWLGFVFGPLAETVVRLAAPDEEVILCEAEQQIDVSEQYLARPQLLRARGLLHQRRGELDGALEALRGSAEIARSQHALIQLGRTLEVLARVARKHGDATCAAQAGAELAAVVQKIGPEVAGLSWASSLLVLRRGSTNADTGLLSPREREVAALIAEGRSNRQIGETLVISERTAEHHVQSILSKLGFDSRAQVAAWVASARPPTRASG